LNFRPGPSALAGATEIKPISKTIAVLPNQPADMPVSSCKFWGIGLGTDCEVQCLASIDPAEWTRRAAFAMKRWINRETLPPDGGITEKVEQIQWCLPIP
jgi:hypothetical protein